MRTRHLLLCICLSLPLFLNAQGIRIGVLNGTAISNAYGKGELPDLQSLNQYWGGVSLEFMHNEHFSIYSSLNYQRKGWKEFAIWDGTFDTKYVFKQSLGYLTLPIQAQYSWGKKIRTSVRLGSYVGYFLHKEFASAIVRDQIIGLNAFPGVPGYSEVDADRWDWGLAGGAGVEIELIPKLYLGLQSNIQLGMKSVGVDLIDRPLAMKNIFGDIAIGINYQISSK